MCDGNDGAIMIHQYSISWLLSSRNHGDAYRRVPVIKPSD